MVVVVVMMAAMMAVAMVATMVAALVAAIVRAVWNYVSVRAVVIRDAMMDVMMVAEDQLAVDAVDRISSDVVEFNLKRFF